MNENIFLNITPADLEKFEKLDKGILIYDKSGNIKYANPYALAILGYATVKDLRNGWKVVPPEYKELINKRIEETLSGEPSPMLTVKLITSSGGEEIVKSRTLPVIFNGEKLSMAIFTREAEERFKRISVKDAFRTVRDVVEPVLEDRFVDLPRVLERIYKSIKVIFTDLDMIFVNLNGDVIFSTLSEMPDTEGSFPLRECMENVKEIYSSGKEIGGKVYTDFVAPVAHGGRVFGALAFRKEGYGAFVPEDVETFRTIAEIASLVSRLSEMMTEIEKEREDLVYKAMRDNLTGAYTRNYLDEFIRKIVSYLTRKGSKVAVVMMDMDNLKFVNDTYGHLEGDKLLRDFSRIVIENIRKSDFLVRLGGDEFLLVLPENGEEGARSTMKRIIERIDEENSTRNPKILFSYGISTVGGKGLDHAIKAADMRMYEMKKRRHSNMF